MLCAGRPPPDYQTVMLKVNMHGDKARRKVVKALESMDKVDDFEVDLEDEKVTVSGHVYPDWVARKLARKTGKRVELWVERSTLSSQRRSYRDSFKRTFSNVFNDENPNSCSVM